MIHADVCLTLVENPLRIAFESLTGVLIYGFLENIMLGLLAPSKDNIFGCIIEGGKISVNYILTWRVKNIDFHSGNKYLGTQWHTLLFMSTNEKKVGVNT